MISIHDQMSKILREWHIPRLRLNLKELSDNILSYFDQCAKLICDLALEVKTDHSWTKTLESRVTLDDEIGNSQKVKP